MKEVFSFCIFCGSANGAEPEFVEKARVLGEYLGSNGHTVVFGGGNNGLMGEVSQAALRAGGKVIGVIPRALIDIERPLSNLTDLIVTDSISERKQKMSEFSDFFIALPGGVGTLDEVFEVITNNWLGLFDKPVAFLDVNDYYRELFQFLDTAVEKGFIRPKCRNLVLRCSDIALLVERLISSKKS